MDVSKIDTHLPDPEAFLPLPPATFHILLALAAGDRHGYGISQDVAERTAGEVKLGPGTLYRTLQKMLDDGLIEELRDRSLATLGDPRRRPYRITPLGTTVARAETTRLARLVELARGAGLALGTV